jgi:5-methylcytosine-specific restriction endonuclease McrA
LTRDYRTERNRLLRQQRKMDKLAIAGWECAVCRGDDLGILEIVIDPVLRTITVLCGNCKARLRPLTPRHRCALARRFLNAGYPDAECLICLESDPRCLRLHHIGGRANDDRVVPLCQNCHSHQSDREIDDLGSLRYPDTNRSTHVRRHAFMLGLAGLGAAGRVAVQGSCRDDVQLVLVTFLALITWHIADTRYRRANGGRPWWTCAGLGSRI